MADLHPSPFCDLVKRMFLEPERQGTIFDLPLRKMYVPDPTLDTTVKFHGRLAANPLGPAAGPQTQMAQNIVLSWLGGSRILELKTVQIDDQLVINRPCIDMTNVGYNIEFSQELRLHESIREYVAGMMLVEMLKASNLLNFPPSAFDKTSTIYDFSLGYNLAGISARPIRDFITSLRNAGTHIDTLRMEIPDRWKQFRDLPYPDEISDSVTLSTFHNCPPTEIEKICHFLLTEIGMGVIVKMNPTMLGLDELNHLLHDRLGFQDIQVNKKAVEAGLKFDDGIQMMRRLQETGRRLGLAVGVKFSNTLEVVNHKTFFPKDEVMYLSGSPLHVITLRLVERWRQNFGPDCPISFSAAVDKHNFANCVACGFVPITTCSDLLKVGGYGRLFEYMKNLETEMTGLHVTNIGDFILKRESNEQAALDHAKNNRDDAVNYAGFLNTSPIWARTVADERYTADKNMAVPKRINSKLHLYDCISCDKCIPVCPNDANFYYELDPVEITFTNYTWAGGQLRPADSGTLKIERRHQIANFADWCNECGNCDTFCPEYGGPFIQKPSFFTDHATWLDNPNRDGFYVTKGDRLARIVGRINGKVFSLALDEQANRARYNDGALEVTLDSVSHSIVEVRPLAPTLTDHRIDMKTYHTLRLLLAGMLNPSRVHPVNVPHL
ncbi:MAG TPA: glutamate synthase [Verrucomicrobiae bacterium]|nr:glutamate synthase [Verrucomicrobiae bacterium]